MTLLDVVVKVIGANEIISTPAANIVPIAVLLVLCESLMRGKIALTDEAIVVRVRIAKVLI